MNDVGTVPPRLRDRFRGCLLGLAVGDALGMPVESHRRGSFEPVVDVVGGGPFRRPAGHWTDDTAMAICLATSLLERDGFDARHQMERYCQWAQRDYLGDTGTCYDMGGVVAESLVNFQRTGEPFAGSLEPDSAGNGCIMRLAPIPLFYFFSDPEAMERFAVDSSRTTHGTQECVDACRLLARIIRRALSGHEKDEIAFDAADLFPRSERIGAIARGDYVRKSDEEIRGSGYVVECLEAAMWCFTRATTFREALLMAVNLGDDADTTAAVCGQVAGAHFGASEIPATWLECLARRSEIEGLADALLARTRPDAVRKAWTPHRAAPAKEK